MPADHIAIILHDFSSGGSERIAIRLANTWSARGRRVTLLCGTEEGAVRNLVAPEIVVEACTPETRRSPWSRLQLGWRLAKLVRKHRPDVVFAPGNFHMVVMAVLGRMDFESRPAFVCKISNPMQRAGGRTMIDDFLVRIIRRATAPIDTLIAMSPLLFAEAEAVVGARRMTCIDEPVLDNQHGFTKRERTNRRIQHIICIGRLEPQKDFLTALRAFALLDPASGVRLTILGEGVQRARLQDEITLLGIGDRVEMPGFVADTKPWLARSDLFLMTSRYEGYPAVLIEAMAAGLPIVTTACSAAIQEIVASTELGAIIPSRTPAAIAQAIGFQLAQAKPGADVIASITARHRIAVGANAYLELFDRIAA
jgi:glycosyltransferase involved in cell wall biosynthesis